GLKGKKLHQGSFSVKPHHTVPGFLGRVLPVNFTFLEVIERGTVFSPNPQILLKELFRHTFRTLPAN
ncbi:MAG: hypothetical protein P4L51_20395, partial [Puia sp.]|nr:hypothetical protein [Puia sp.]